MRSALVLGGGGVTGIGWELGILGGLADTGVDLTAADTVIGTSAGAAVAAQVTTGDGVGAALAVQLDPDHSEIAVGPWRLLRLMAAMAWPGEEDVRLARVGRLALRAKPVASAERRLEVIRSRLGDVTWPERDVRLTAVEAETGRFTVFDRNSGVDLVDAVAASCAVPAVWPPVAIDGRYYVDGGMRSAVNADLAAGADIVVVVAPVARATSKAMAIPTQLAATGAAHTVVITPDKEARAAMGRNPLDPGKRAAAARAGLRQAGAVLATLDAWPVP